MLPTLVAAAQSAPTSSNLQLWSVVAVTDPARLTTLSGDQDHVRDAPHPLVWIADLARVLTRMRGNGSLRGRERLRSALAALGMPSW